MTELGAALPPSTRRANLMISGLRRVHTRGRMLCVGSCRLRIRSECTPCERMEEGLPGLSVPDSRPRGIRKTCRMAYVHDHLTRAGPLSS